MLSPSERYKKDLQQEEFMEDPAQALAVSKLQDLYERLMKRYMGENQSRSGRRFAKRFRSTPVQPEQGLYFWGGVGRGKTYLVDIFYDALPFKKKMRIHFHRFMQRIHHELRLVSGQKNPMRLVVDKIAKETHIICFDEFYVSDITDAMILAELMKSLFYRGVCLVATSNIPPDNLYKNGLQRQRFIPAIDLLKQNVDVYEIDGGVDYRLRVLEKAELYYQPNDEQAEKNMLSFFQELVPDAEHVAQKAQMEVLGRKIDARFIADDVAWFEFGTICDIPRSQNDYIELSKEYHAVLISNVPQLGGARDDQARRFINLVDEFYDRSVKLILSAEEPLENLYAGGMLEFEFKRTLSRLQEMQSVEYLQREHKT